jgi:stress-induced-phosphoprotein 1
MTTPTSNAEELKALGNKEFAAGNFASAIKYFTEAIQVDPSNAVLYSNRSGAHSSTKNYQPALEDAERAVELRSEWGKAWSRKATALQGLGRWEEAFKAWAKVREIEPSNEGLQKNLQFCMQAMIAKFQTQMPNTASPPEPSSTAEEPIIPESKVEEPKKEISQAEELKELGTIEYKKRNFDAALEYYQKASELEPENMNYILNQSAVLFEQGLSEKCIKKCEEAIEVGKSHYAPYAQMAKAYTRMGSCWEKLGKLDQAILFYQKSLTEHRTPDAQSKLKEAEKTLAAQKRAELQDPVLAEQDRERGNQLFKEGKFAEAVQAYSEAIKRAEADPRAFANRAACYLKLVAVPEGLKDCDKALELDPMFLKAYTRKAALLLLKKDNRDYTEVLEVCDKALALNPDPAISRELEGYRMKAMMELGNPGDKDGQSALKDPEVQAILTDPVMQQILSQMKDDPKAISDHMKSPVVAAKIRKLIAAGVIKVR